jgi:hypothetical protein
LVQVITSEKLDSGRSTSALTHGTDLMLQDYQIMNEGKVERLITQWEILSMRITVNNSYTKVLYIISLI